MHIAQGIFDGALLFEFGGFSRYLLQLDRGHLEVGDFGARVDFIECQQLAAASTKWKGKKSVPAGERPVTMT